MIKLKKWLWCDDSDEDDEDADGDDDAGDWWHQQLTGHWLETGVSSAGQCVTVSTCCILQPPPPHTGPHSTHHTSPHNYQPPHSPAQCDFILENSHWCSE